MVRDFYRYVYDKYTWTDLSPYAYPIAASNSYSRSYQRPQGLSGVPKDSSSVTKDLNQTFSASELEIKNLRFARHISAFDVDIDSLGDNTDQNFYHFWVLMNDIF